MLPLTIKRIPAGGLGQSGPGDHVWNDHVWNDHVWDNQQKALTPGAGEVEIGMLHCRFGSAPLALFAVWAAAQAPAQAEPRALVELFTSQGCSSCPPADKLLGDLADDPSVVALSVPIDYWDYLGWKDTLAIPGHTSRQRAYAHVRGDRQVYTPQVVVNGSMHVLGSDRDAIERAVAQTDHNSAVMALPVMLTVGVNNLNVKVGTTENEHTSGEVWLCPLTRAVTVAIGRGENHGHTITYHNVVRRWLKLGDWAGKEQSFSVPLSDMKAADIDGAAVMVQEGTKERPGIILGAAFTSVDRPTVAQPVTDPMFALPAADSASKAAHQDSDGK